MELRLSTNDLPFETEPENDLATFLPAAYLEDSGLEPGTKLELLESQNKAGAALKKSYRTARSEKQRHT